MNRIATHRAKRRLGGRTYQEQETHSDSLILQPWFLPIKTARAIRALVPRDYRMRLSDYFAWYGCIRCEKKSVPYQGNGFCQNCAVKIHHRLARCVKRRIRSAEPDRYGRKFLLDARHARRLLKGFPATMWVNAKKRMGTRNPARDAFVVMSDGVRTPTSTKRNAASMRISRS
jgi:hypothetical protein